MKIVVIGGSGLIGSKVSKRLRAGGHEVVSASPASGVDTLTGKGLDQALEGAHAVLDVSNSPSFEDKAVLEFFQVSGRNLLAAGKKAGIRHHIALSVVGTDRLGESGYFRAKMAQEALIRESGLPYTIVHSTQFFEFLGAIAQSAALGDDVHLSPAYVQPIASDDVADAVSEYTVSAPLNGVVEIAGPERARLSELVQRFLTASNDPRNVVADVHARYFGAELKDTTLIPGRGARIGDIDFEAWFAASQAPR